MTDERDVNAHAVEEAAMVRLLQLTGARPAVPAERAARVRAAVHARWRVASRRRAVLRRVLSGSFVVAAAAGVVLVVNALHFGGGRDPAPGAAVAVVEQVEGTPQRGTAASGEPEGASLSRNETIRTGDWIRTDGHARVALRFSDGTSVRLDVGSRARPLSAGAIELSTGAAYVDTGRESGRFEVRTAMGIARDVGTQFEVRLLDRTLRLRVRTGAVELHDGARSVSARAGTEITFTDGTAVSRPVAAYGSEWDWTTRVSPSPDIEGMPLSVFLDRIAREHGWTLTYADPQLGREASGIILHGSVEGLRPREAIEVAIATSSLRHRLEDGQLVVLRSAR